MCTSKPQIFLNLAKKWLAFRRRFLQRRRVDFRQRVHVPRVVQLTKMLLLPRVAADASNHALPVAFSEKTSTCVVKISINIRGKKKN